MQTGAPLAYVVGQKFIAGNLSFFSPDHPLVLRDGDAGRSPWIDTADLAERGTAVLWDPSSASEAVIAGFRARFPTMQMQPPILISWRGYANLPLLRIQWGLVPPAGRWMSPTALATGSSQR